MEFTLDSIRDLDAVVARRAAASDAAASAFSCRGAVPYGPGPAETLDLYPARHEAAPVLVFVHGGFWSTMQAAQFAFLAPGFVPFGAALAVIDYPLIPDVRMADVVASCARAVRFVHAQAGRLGLDPGRIHVAGNSAGGHLVAEMMDDAEARPLIRGGTAISGLFDLAPVAESFRNDLLQFTPGEVARFSPLLRPFTSAAPLVVAVGGDETGEFLRQSAAFAGHAGPHTEHMVVPGANHITVVLDHLADPAAPLNGAVRRQMGLAG